MSLRDQLSDIHQRYGQLTPQIVVDEARPKSHPLHGRFEWDDRVGGEAYRRIQAQELIRSVRVVYQPATDVDPEKSVRAFQAVKSAEGFVYEPSEKVAADPFLSQLVLNDMERDWKALKRRYETFAEFWQMVRGDAQQPKKKAAAGRGR